MSSSKHNNPAAATPKAVQVYAALLRRQAVTARVRDPHIQLYAPSADTAKKLCSQLGPAAALVELARRARVRELRFEEEEASASAGRDRLRTVQLVVLEEARVRRDELSLGQRLDAALMGVAVAPGVGSSRLDADRVSGGGHGDGGVSGSRRDREVSIAREDAVRAVERLEGLVERDRRRLVEREAA